MTRRLSVTLEPEDQRLVTAFEDPATAEHAALAAWATDRGLDPERFATEASIIRALLRAGAESLREQALGEGYAALAAELTAEEREETRSARDRYVRRTERRARE